jgi:competence protein ComEA
MWPTSISSTQLSSDSRWLAWWSELALSRKIALGLVILGSAIMVLSIVGLVVAHSQVQAASALELKAGLPDPNRSVTSLDESAFNLTEAQLSSNSSNVSLIWVEVSGAVNKPGVYELPSGSRVKAALDSAEGVTSQAQPDFVLKSLNQALILEDETKLYIPFRGEKLAAQLADPPPEPSLSESTPDQISINTASSVQLEELPGIGSKRAEDIISGRPYQKIEELIERKIVTDSIWADIQNLIKI